MSGGSLSDRAAALSHIEHMLQRRTRVPVRISWSPAFRPEWNATPACYVDAGTVEWGRSRRLAKIDVPVARFKSYLGLQAWDPGRWHLAGDPQAKFFLSLFFAGRTSVLRTYPSGEEALDALADALARL